MDPITINSLLVILGLAGGTVGGIVILGILVVPGLLRIYQQAIRDLDGRTQDLQEQCDDLEVRLKRATRKVALIEEFFNKDVALPVLERPGGEILVAAWRQKLYTILRDDT